MNPTLSVMWTWLKTHEQSVAIWLEGLALVAIFGLELREYFRQGKGRKEQHEQTLAQMEIMRNQARATETSANAARRSAEISEMALKLAERADVLLNAVSLITKIPGLPSNSYTNRINPYSRVIMEFKNFGRTRADNVRCLIGLVIPGVPDSVPPREPFVLGPGGTQELTFKTFIETLNQETIDQIAKGKIPLRFAGKVVYDDIFGESHTLLCSGVFDPMTGAFIMGESNPRKMGESS